MDATISTERQARTQHRHELRTLTYVTLDQANGGIVRNLHQNGIGAQVVAAMRPQQQLRIRFELRSPRVRVETRGEVVWSTYSGQCGIRFLDPSPALRRQINEWILGDLLETVALHAQQPGSMFAVRTVEDETALDPVPDRGVEEDDGLLLSGTPAKVIPLPMRTDIQESLLEEVREANAGTLDWLSQPLSARGIATAIDTLTVLAAFLLFALVFLAMTREAPPWPVSMTLGGALLMALLYWGFFWTFGGKSLGARLAQKAELENSDETDGD